MDLKECKMNDLQECYKKMQKNCGIQSGDIVKVLRKAESFELGWDNEWISPSMDKMVGKCFKVHNNYGLYGFSLEISEGNYSLNVPWFVLELVEKKKELDFKNDYDTVIKLHREIWTWLSENPSKTKIQWPGWEKYGIDPEDVENCCFLCEWSKLDSGEVDCVACPGKWGDYSAVHGDFGITPCEIGEFGFYCTSGDFSEYVLSRMYEKIVKICD